MNDDDIMFYSLMFYSLMLYILFGYSAYYSIMNYEGLLSFIILVASIAMIVLITFFSKEVIELNGKR